MASFLNFIFLSQFFFQVLSSLLNIFNSNFNEYHYPYQSICTRNQKQACNFQEPHNASLNILIKQLNYDMIQIEY